MQFICELSEYDAAAKILMGLEKGKGVEKKCILTESIVLIYEEVIT